MDPERNSRTTAIGLARYAKEYLEAAIVVEQEMGSKKEHVTVSPIPAYFLLTHGIELTLKSYLRHAGLSVEDLSKVGHDLKALYAKAQELGLDALYQMTAKDAEAFVLLVAVNEFHQLRYIQTGFKTFPLWGVAEPFAVRLHQAVAPKVGYESLTVAYPAAATSAPAVSTAPATAPAGPKTKSILDVQGILTPPDGVRVSVEDMRR